MEQMEQQHQNNLPLPPLMPPPVLLSLASFMQRDGVEMAPNAHSCTPLLQSKYTDTIVDYSNLIAENQPLHPLLHLQLLSLNLLPKSTVSILRLQPLQLLQLLISLRWQPTSPTTVSTILLPLQNHSLPLQTVCPVLILINLLHSIIHKIVMLIVNSVANHSHASVTSAIDLVPFPTARSPTIANPTNIMNIWPTSPPAQMANPPFSSSPTSFSPSFSSPPARALGLQLGSLSSSPSFLSSSPFSLFMTTKEVEDEDADDDDDELLPIPGTNANQ